MNELVLSDVVMRLASGWGDAYLLRGCIAAVGVLVLVVSLMACRKHSLSTLSCVVWCVISFGLLAFAAFPEQIVTNFISIEYVIRMRVIAGIVSILVLLITLESIRRTHLQERYAILWLITAGFILFVSLFPHAIDLLRALMGMSYVAAVVAFAFVFLLLVAFHFSMTLSAMQQKQSQMAQRIALLEEELGRQCPGSSTGDDPEPGASAAHGDRS